jgi:hypothetical protein
VHSTYLHSFNPLQFSGLSWSVGFSQTRPTRSHLTPLFLLDEEGGVLLCAHRPFGYDPYDMLCKCGRNGTDADPIGPPTFWCAPTTDLTYISEERRTLRIFDGDGDGNDACAPLPTRTRMPSGRLTSTATSGAATALFGSCAVSPGRSGAARSFDGWYASGAGRLGIRA